MKKNLKYYLKGKLSKNHLKLVPTSFDVVGDILIFVDFPKGLASKDKIIGKGVLDNYSNIKTVLRKTKKYSGKYRTPKLKYIIGEKRKETVYRENNVFIKLDVEKVYFSSRLGNERNRISKLIKPDESILVMFSGCGVYPVVIGKNTKVKEIYGIEINPAAHKYALENVKKNKLEGIVKLYQGDVKKVLPKIKRKFDRILMPLPKDADKFLDLTLKYVKKSGTIHLYTFSMEDEMKKAGEKVKLICKKAKKKCRILRIVKCGQFAPRQFRVCVDFKI
jgi:tRNA (guanine37-N1)-methyltransferase